MTNKRWPVLVLTYLGLACALLLTHFIWWLSFARGSLTTLPEVRRLGTIQLRVLRQARQRTEDHLREIDQKLQQFAADPAIITPSAKTPDNEDPVMIFISGAEMTGALLRRYDRSLNVLMEAKQQPQNRFPKLKRSRLEKLLEWAEDEEHRFETFVELLDPQEHEEAGQHHLTLSCTPVWKPVDGKLTFDGVLFLLIPSSFFLRPSLEQTLILPESYSFGLQVQDEQTQKADLIWHSAEPSWRMSQVTDARRFVQALEQRKEFYGDLKEDNLQISLPKPDGNEREEILAFASMVFGSKRWILGLSTPYIVATEYTRTIRNLALGLAAGLGALALLGTVFLLWQQNQLAADAQADLQVKLNQMQQQYRDLFAENPMSLWIMNEDGAIVDCNYSGERLLGLSRQETIGAGLLELFEPETINPLWQQLHNRGNLHLLDCKLTRRTDQSNAFLEVWGRKIGDRYVLMATDVEQRRELEQQITRLKRMESVGALASTLAHDFNNSLGKVMVVVSNVKSETSPSTELYKDLETIEQHVSDAAQMVSNLLEMREEVVATTPVLIEPVLNEFAGNESRSLPLEVDLQFSVETEDAKVLITPTALRRVLSNLWINACDAMQYGGTLKLRATKRWIDDKSVGQLPANHYVVIEVSDTGTGMPPEVLEAIFEPFFSTKGERKGTGLGLWTVYKMVRRAGGWVNVSSRVGKGTRFTVYLPCAA